MNHDTSPEAVKEFKCCEPRLGYDCDFPNCHTKDELKAIIEDKQRQLDAAMGWLEDLSDHIPEGELARIRALSDNQTEENHD